MRAFGLQTLWRKRNTWEPDVTWCHCTCRWVTTGKETKEGTVMCEDSRRRLSRSCTFLVFVLFETVSVYAFATPTTRPCVRREAAQADDHREVKQMWLFKYFVPFSLFSSGWDDETVRHSRAPVCCIDRQSFPLARRGSSTCAECDTECKLCVEGRPSEKQVLKPKWCVCPFPPEPVSHVPIPKTTNRRFPVFPHSGGNLIKSVRLKLLG